MNCQMIRVISSPSSSTTGFATLIFAMTSPRALEPECSNSAERPLDIRLHVARRSGDSRFATVPRHLHPSCRLLTNETEFIRNHLAQNELLNFASYCHREIFYKFHVSRDFIMRNLPTTEFLNLFRGTNHTWFENDTGTEFLTIPQVRNAYTLYILNFWM